MSERERVIEREREREKASSLGQLKSRPQG